MRIISHLLPGLYDMLGNVWEWTSSNFPGAQTMYVLRGASWIDTADGSANHRARVTTRSVMLYAYYSKSAFIRLLLVLLVTLPVDTKQVHQQLLKFLSKAIYWEYDEQNVYFMFSHAGWETHQIQPLITWASAVQWAQMQNRKGLSFKGQMFKTSWCQWCIMGLILHFSRGDINFCNSVLYLLFSPQNTVKLKS